VNVEVAFSRIITVDDPPDDIRPGTLARMSWAWQRVAEHLGPEQAAAVVSWVETHQPPRTPTRDRDQVLALGAADREFLRWALTLVEANYADRTDIQRRVAALRGRLNQ
jgi:hypothetical protein